LFYQHHLLREDALKVINASELLTYPIPNTITSYPQICGAWIQVEVPDHKSTSYALDCPHQMIRLIDPAQ
jgi:hypothetical protein